MSRSSTYCIFRSSPFTTSSVADFCEASNDGDNDANDPSSWYDDIEPFIVLRYFAPKEVSDEQIRDELDENSIGTLQELKQFSSRVCTRLVGEDITDVGSAIVNTLRNRIRKTAEQILGEQKIVYDTSCLPQKCYDWYAPAAVSVDPPAFPQTAGNTNRHPDITLVLGSSGSGKTLFAMRRIPEWLFGNDETAYFRIHFRARRVTDLMTEEKGTLDFPLAVATIVHDVIGDVLFRKGLYNIKVLNIPIHVTIDEAGGKVFKEYFDTAGKIRNIIDAVKTKGKFEFQREIHITLAGTRLEINTMDIESDVEIKKFRMKPWKTENFHALVDKSHHPQPIRVKEVVHRFPVLEDLTSNARCAFFVLETMENLALLRENRVQSSVPVIVSSVADSYVYSSGLDYLKNAEDKWKVARSVFRALDRSTRNPNAAFFPHFEDLDSEQFRFIANSMLDINVESRFGKPRSVDVGSRYSTSMTPALAIVVANLLSTEAKISWDWQGFETTVMLGELKRMIVHAQDFSTHPDKPVLQLQSPLPADPATKSFSVPVVDRYTVVLNGPKAEYAHVIAPYRLVQAKFSKDNTKPLSLDLQNELDKMGLTHSSEHLLQQYITTVFHTFWRKGLEAPSWTAGESILQLVNKNMRFECYPFNILNKKIVFEHPKVIQGRLEGEKCMIDEDATGERFEWLATFDKSQPVTAVFATNCREFTLKIRKRDKSTATSTTIEYEEETVAIRHSHVDWQGKLKKEVGVFSQLGLRENVKISFLFY
jgi:hypothetical protein